MKAFLFSDQKLQEVLQFEIMQLSGGNSVQFLNDIKIRNFDKIIEGFRADKLVIGVSSGSILTLIEKKRELSRNK